MKKKNPLKKKIGKWHLWIGLLIGVPVFFISITGALYAFQAEITSLIRKDVIHHQEEGIEHKKTLPLKILENKINLQTKEQYPLHWVNIPLDKSKSYIFYYYEHNPNAWNYFEEYLVYKSVYVNPYTGAVLAVYNEKMDFFNLVKSFHFSFFLKSDWGTYVCGIPTLLFIFMLFTGIILWWPKNKAARKQRFWFNWKNIKNWKRKNYDLHNILGFYSSLLALIIAFTGIFYSFFFVKAIFYFVFSGGQTVYPDFSHITTQAPKSMQTHSTLDKIASKVETEFPNAYMYSLDFGHPHLDDHEHPNYTVFVKQLEYSYHINHDLIFDEHSGELLHKHAHNNKNFGEKMIAANYDIHIGSILGLPGKILAFLLSLICASLPITGFLIWWGKTNKNK